MEKWCPCGAHQFRDRVLFRITGEVRDTREGNEFKKAREIIAAVESQITFQPLRPSPGQHKMADIEISAAFNTVQST